MGTRSFPAPPPPPQQQPAVDSEDEVIPLKPKEASGSTRGRKNSPDPPELKDEAVEPTDEFQASYDKHNLNNGYGVKAVEQQLALEAFFAPFSQPNFNYITHGTNRQEGPHYSYKHSTERSSKFR